MKDWEGEKKLRDISNLFKQRSMTAVVYKGILNWH